MNHTRLNRTLKQNINHRCYFMLYDAACCCNSTGLKTIITNTHPCLPSSGCHTLHYYHLLLNSRTAPHSGALRSSKRDHKYHTYIEGVNSKVTYFELTHVSFVFGHSCHSVLVCRKLYICLPGYPAVWSDFNMYPDWIQWREELRNANKGHIYSWYYTATANFLICCNGS